MTHTLRYRRPDSTDRLLAIADKYRGDGVAFYAPWGLQGAKVNVVGVTVREFDPVAVHRQLFGNDG